MGVIPASCDQDPLISQEVGSNQPTTIVSSVSAWVCIITTIRNMCVSTYMYGYYIFVCASYDAYVLVPHTVIGRQPRPPPSSAQ